MKQILTILLFTIPFIGLAQSESNPYKKYNEAMEKGKMKKAHRELQKIAKTQTNKYIHFMTLGNYYGKQGNLDSAAHYLSMAVLYNSNEPMIANQEGYYELRDSLRRKSISTLNRMIEISPKRDYYVDRSNYEFLVGDFQSALADIKVSIEMDSTIANNFYNQGVIYSNLNELDSAIMSYNRCLELDPKYGSAHLNKGFIFIKKKSHRRAIQEFKKALDILEGTKDISFTLNNIGYCYIKLENFEKARFYIDESISLNPFNSYAFRNLALLEIGVEDKSAACKAIEKAIELGFVQDYGNEILELQAANCK